MSWGCKSIGIQNSLKAFLGDFSKHQNHMNINLQKENKVHIWKTPNWHCPKHSLSGISNEVYSKFIFYSVIKSNYHIICKLKDQICYNFPKY